MDWNNINTDRDTSGLGPIEYDQTKVPALIRQYADDVRTKTYGQQVREAQARNAEYAGLIAVESKELSEETKARQDTLENYNDQIILEMTDKDVISAPELIESRDGEIKLSHRLTRDFGKIDTQVANIENQLEITPDAFEGTDAEKIQQAYDYAMANNITKILLNREYDITGSSIWLPEGSWNTPLSYITFSGGKIRKDDAGFMFDSTGLNTADGVFRIAPQFLNTDFDSVTGKKEIHVFNGDKMIRINMVNCYFRTVGLVKSTTYIQTVRTENCITGYMGCHFIDAPRSYDVEIINPRSESNQSQDKRLIQLVSHTAHASYYGLKVSGGLIEGYWNTHPIEIGGGFGLDISGVYFERNTSSIVFKEMPDAINRVVGKIDNCVFLHNEGTGQDIMMDDGIDDRNLLIENNSKRRDETGGQTESGQYLTNRRPKNPRNATGSNVNYLGATAFPDMWRVAYNFVEGASSITVSLPEIPIKDLRNKLWLLSVSYNPNTNTSQNNQTHKVGILSVTTDGTMSSVVYTPLLGGDYPGYFFVQSTSRNISVNQVGAQIKLNLSNGVPDDRNTVSIAEFSHIASQ